MNEPKFQDFNDELTIEQVISKLENHKCLVVFTKADGSITKMECSAHEIPGSDKMDYDLASKPDLLHVYSFDRAGWRSFKFSRLISIEII